MGEQYQEIIFTLPASSPSLTSPSPLILLILLLLLLFFFFFFSLSYLSTSSSSLTIFFALSFRSPRINLRGFLAGNPSGLYTKEFAYSYYAFMREHALISPGDMQVGEGERERERGKERRARERG